jgi:hypothetical protein
MIGRLIERLFVQVRADMTDLSRDLSQGVAQTRAATNAMGLSWDQVNSHVQLLNQKLSQGKIVQAQYTSEMNRLASSMKVVAGSYRSAQKEVWGYAKAAQVASRVKPIPVQPMRLFARSAGQARMQMMNLGYQLNDIGMTLATGMNPMTVMIQQGSQIAQIYGGQGGVRMALSDMGSLLGGLAKRAWPIALIAAAFAGLRHEINKTSETQVSMGDTIKAVFQVIGSAIMEKLQPAIDWIAPYFQKAWDMVVASVKWVGNTLINSIRVAVAGIGAAVGGIPGIFKNAFWSGVALAMEALYKLGSSVEKMMGGIAKAMNTVFRTSLDENPVYDWVSSLEFYRYSAQKAADETKGLGEAMSDFGATASEIWNSDPMGEFFTAVKDQAVQNALKRTADGMEDIGNKAAGTAEKTKEAMDQVAESVGKAADNFANIFTSAFDRLVETGKFSFSDLIQSINKMLLQFASGAFSQAMNGLFRSIVGSGSGGFGGLLTGLFGGFGGNLGFNARGGIRMPWENFIAGEEGAELISQDGPSGARRIKTAGQTRHAMKNSGRMGPQITMIIQTPDAESFRKSQSQVASQMGRLIAKGQRNQ